MEYAERIENISIFSIFLKMSVHGNALLTKSSNSGHLDWKSYKIRGFRSFFLIREIDMRYRIELLSIYSTAADLVENSRKL